MTTSANGRAERKSLAGQLDRLDAILDGLADGLNEAVATAVKQAVVVAVEAAVRELLTSAELQRRLRIEEAARTGFLRRTASVMCRGLLSVGKGAWCCVTALVGTCRKKTTRVVSTLRESLAAIVSRVRRGMTALARQVWLVWFVPAGMVRRFHKPLLVAAAVGVALAVACYFAGPTVSSLVNGVAGFLGALAAGVLGRLRPGLRRLATGEWDVSRFP